MNLEARIFEAVTSDRERKVLRTGIDQPMFLAGIHTDQRPRSFIGGEIIILARSTGIASRIADVRYIDANSRHWCGAIGQKWTVIECIAVTIRIDTSNINCAKATC